MRTLESKWGINVWQTMNNTEHRSSLLQSAMKCSRNDGVIGCDNDGSNDEHDASGNVDKSSGHDQHWGDLHSFDASINCHQSRRYKHFTTHRGHNDAFGNHYHANRDNNG